MALTLGAKRQDGREVSWRVQGIIGKEPGVWKGGGSLWVLGGGGEGEALQVKRWSSTAAWLTGVTQRHGRSTIG